MNEFQAGCLLFLLLCLIVHLSLIGYYLGQIHLQMKHHEILLLEQENRARQRQHLKETMEGTSNGK